MGFDKGYFNELSAIVEHFKATGGIVRPNRAHGRAGAAKANTTAAGNNPVAKMLREVDAGYKPGALKAHMERTLRREGRLK